MPLSIVSWSYDFQIYGHSKRTLSLYIRTASTAGGESCRRPWPTPSFTSRIRQPDALTLGSTSRSCLVPEAELPPRIASLVLLLPLAWTNEAAAIATRPVEGIKIEEAQVSDIAHADYTGDPVADDTRRR